MERRRLRFETPATRMSFANNRTMWIAPRSPWSTLCSNCDNSWCEQHTANTHAPAQVLKPLATRELEPRFAEIKKAHRKGHSDLGLCPPLACTYLSGREGSELSRPRFLINTGRKWEIREDVNSHSNLTRAAWEGWEELILWTACLHEMVLSFLMGFIDTSGLLSVSHWWRSALWHFQKGGCKTGNNGTSS